MGGVEAPRILDTVIEGPGDAAWNLAIDEALLSDARAWLRVYSWGKTSISIGYFQRWADFADLASEYPLVRRATGGAAIAHGPGELTLATALPESWLPNGAEAASCWLTKCVREAARTQGIDLRLGTRPVDTRRQRWCFAEACRLDLADDEGRKAFGSAQRRRDGRVLQHGTLVFEAPPEGCATGELRAAREPFVAALVEVATSSLRSERRELRTFPPEVLEEARRFQDRHRSEAWLQRR